MYVRGDGNDALERLPAVVLRRRLPDPDLDRGACGETLDDAPVEQFPPAANVPAKQRRPRARCRRTRPAPTPDAEPPTAKPTPTRRRPPPRRLRRSDAGPDPDADADAEPRPRAPAAPSRRPADGGRSRPVAGGSPARRGNARRPAAARPRRRRWRRAMRGSSGPRAPTRWCGRRARASAGPSVTALPRHWWWTPVRVVLAVAALAFVLGMVQKTPCVRDNWAGHELRYGAMCYSDVPYLYSGRGLRRRLPAVRRQRRPLPGDGVPGGDRLLRLRRRAGHPGPRRRRRRPAARGRGPDRDLRPARRRRGVRAATSRSPRCCWPRSRCSPPGSSRACTGDGPGTRCVRGLTRAGADRADQLGPARGRRAWPARCGPGRAAGRCSPGC